MITAFPLFLSPTERASHTDGLTDGTGLGQSQISGKSSGNPFEKILQDQPAKVFPLIDMPVSIPKEDKGGPLDKKLQNSLPAELMNAGESDGLFPEYSLGHDELSLVDLQLTPVLHPNSYSEVVPGIKEQLSHGIENVPAKSLTLHPSLNGYGTGELNGAARLDDLLRVPLDELLFRRPSSVGFPPQVRLPVGPEANVVQTMSTMNKPTDTSTVPPLIHSALPQLAGDAIKGHAQGMNAFDGEAATESELETGKIVEKPMERPTRLVQDPANSTLRILSTPPRLLQVPHNPTFNQAFQSPIPFQETPASLAEIAQLNLVRLKNANGFSSAMGDTSLSGKESSLSLTSDLLRETNVSPTGDRSKDNLDTAGKSAGVDLGGGQGINNSMGGFSQFQSGLHHHSSSSSSSGANVRMTEERVPDLPAPALQRLQMDVQVSETNRIQIDVGVQQRQVYAGLLMEQGTLKNLAVQLIPQLEEQLAKVDMDLQEFSAEVRDHGRERESDRAAHWLGMPSRKEAHSSIHPTHESLLVSVKPFREHGLHFVA